MENVKKIFKEKFLYILGGILLITSGGINLKVMVTEKMVELKKQGFDYALQKLAETAQKSGRVSISFPDTNGNVQTLSLIVEIKSGDIQK